MDGSSGNEYLKDVIQQLFRLKNVADGAISQVSDDEFFARLDDQSNSIALIMKHMAGNMRSRWTDFLTSDGEKPDRNRPSEFRPEDEDSRESIMRRWTDGWDTLFAALQPLRAEDLSKRVTIRGEPQTVIEAINRQLIHYALHVGQIVFLAKHFRAGTWETQDRQWGRKMPDVTRMTRPKAINDSPSETVANPGEHV